jgi:hypothetical protein
MKPGLAAAVRQQTLDLPIRSRLAKADFSTRRWAPIDAADACWTNNSPMKNDSSRTFQRGRHKG